MFTSSRARGGDGLPVLGKGKQIALDVARGLAFLHSQHVVHLDLKSPNGACWSPFRSPGFGLEVQQHLDRLQGQILAFLCPGMSFGSFELSDPG